MKNEDKNIISRKYKIIPIDSYRKEWIKRINNFLNTEKDRFSEEEVNNYTMDLIKRSCKSEAIRKNLLLSYVYTELINRDVYSMEEKERNELINELCNYGLRIETSKNGSLFSGMEIDNPLGGYSFGSYSQDFKKRIKKDINKNNLLLGGCSLRTYKEDSPVTISKDMIGFSHDYDSYEELCEYVYKPKTNLYFNLGKNGEPTIARFKFELGCGKKRRQLTTDLLKIYSGEWDYGGSQIEIKDKEIFLILSIKVPKNRADYLDESIKVGVDLGLATTAVCGVNVGGNYLFLGGAHDLLRVRTQFRNERKRLQQSLSMAKGGHGRKRKMKATERFKDREANWAETYNHNISKRIVEFALENHAKYIILEDLTSFNKKKAKDKRKYKLLGVWSYYQLQMYIEYKAAQVGIEVKYINPYLTSQTCNCCGHYEKGQRDGRSFVCKGCGKSMNADLNAAFNIARSENYVNKNKIKN